MVFKILNITAHSGRFVRVVQKSDVVRLNPLISTSFGSLTPLSMFANPVEYMFFKFKFSVCLFGTMCSVGNIFHQKQ